MRFVLCLLVFTFPTSLLAQISYLEGQKKSIETGKRHVTYVGCKVRDVPDCICSYAESLEGYTAPCIVIAVPRDGHTWFESQLPHDAEVAVDDPLNEVNAARARRGLRPFLRDEGLTQAAQAAAAFRADKRIAGHTSNDFAFLPPGSNAPAAGCGALEPSWGWGTCCTYDNYTFAGAGMVLGSDGRRYMHLFVR